MSKGQGFSIKDLRRVLAAPLDAFVRDPGIALVLIGSVARSCQTEHSDVDILLLSPLAISKRPQLANFEFHVFTPDKFVRLGLSGDDFPNWCARFGVPILGNRVWTDALGELENAPWPTWRKKIETATKRLVSAELFANCRDYGASKEELLFGYDHLTRALLLQAKQFPLSRPELPEQVRTLDRRVGERLRSLELRKATASDLKHLIQALRSQIREIAPDQADLADARIGKLTASTKSKDLLTLGS
jgi:predicted nucleotidyltransferase